ncbi:MAG TPA: hypothetical protein VN682_17090 [Terriglobales bacterium]|nr:hypothetical protein [Terriglobales bacterium]
MRYLVLFGLLIGTSVHAQVKTPAPCVKPNPNNPECIRLLPQVDSQPVVIKDSTPIKVDLPQTPNVVYLEPTQPLILPAPVAIQPTPVVNHSVNVENRTYQSYSAPSPSAPPPGAGFLWGFSQGFANAAIYNPPIDEKAQLRKRVKKFCHDHPDGNWHFTKPEDVTASCTLIKQTMKWK